MKKIAIYFISLVCILFFSSCEDFLNRYPKDALSPATTWLTQGDAERFLIGLYSGNGFIHGELFFYLDCASDIGFSFHAHEGWRAIGNGTMSPTGQVSNQYTFGTIRRVNYFLSNIDRVEMDEAVRRDMIAQARFIRAWRYYLLNRMYGGVPIITDLPISAEDAQRPRNTNEEVRDFIFSELDLALLDIRDTPAQTGRVARGAVLALKMRSALWHGNYQRALDASRAITALGQYQLFRDGTPYAFSRLFSIAERNNSEIILSRQRINPGDTEWFVTIPNNADGGWSSMVPTQNLINMFEMANGLTRCNPASGYDPTRPFYNRDPRMAMTVLVPGIYWPTNYRGILNALDQYLPNGTSNPNFPRGANNASSTGLTWAKYFLPREQFLNDEGNPVWNPVGVQYIAFRYAEVLLTRAETSNELFGPSNEVYDALDDIRNRAGMPPVDRARYNTQETLRELIRRERTVELAGEGVRRFDIIRWGIAQEVMNGPLLRAVGTIDYDEPNPFRRAIISGTELIEDRVFLPHHRFLPFPQSAINNNPNLKQDPEWDN